VAGGQWLVVSWEGDGRAIPTPRVSQWETNSPLTTSEMKGEARLSLFLRFPGFALYDAFRASLPLSDAGDCLPLPPFPERS